MLPEAGWIQMDGLGIQKLPEEAISARTGENCSLQTSFAISAVTLLPTAEAALP